MSTSQFNQTQRTAFENTLREKLREAQSTFQAKQREAQQTALNTIIERKGVGELVTTVKTLRDQLEATEKELASHGFEVRNDGDVRIAYSAPRELEEEYEGIVDEQITDAKLKVDEIQEAVRGSWQIASVDEAKELIQSLT